MAIFKESNYRYNVILFELSQDLPVTPEHAWSIWTDVMRWPEWDPNIQASSLNGRFMSRTEGWSRGKTSKARKFVITEAVESQRWVSFTAFAGGGLELTHSLALRPRGCRATVSVRATGPMAVIIKALVGPKLRLQIPQMLRALSLRAAPSKSSSSPSGIFKSRDSSIR
jgi:hypothetical protein